jgi:hypothetical protein
MKLKVQLNSFVYEYSLPITLVKGDSNNCFIMRDIITGGLSNTIHRLNIAGESEINKIKKNT